MTEEEINKAIARIILSTKRKSRQYSLVEIATDILTLKNVIGMQKVVGIVGISSGMLNQFLSVFKLPEIAFEIVKSRKIDSVAMVHYLAKFEPADIPQLAELLSKNELTSQDLRILLPFRKQFTQEPILELVKRIKSSKNIKVSIVRIDRHDTQKSIDELTSAFVSQVGEENLNSIVSNGDFVDIKLTKKGENILRKVAKQGKKTLQELITTLI